MASNTYATFKPQGSFALRAVTKGIVAAEDAPTLATHGLDVTGKTTVDARVSMGDATSITVIPYVASKDEDGNLVHWQQMTDGDGVLWTKTITSGGTFQFNVKADDIFDLRISATDATDNLSNKVLTATGPTV